MHFGFALELSDIDLWNIDLLDTHLDLLDRNAPVSILFDPIVSSRRLQDISSRHLQYMFSRRLQYVFKTCLDVQDVFKTSKCLLGRNVKYLLKRRPQNFDFLILKNSSSGQFWGAPTHVDVSLNFKISCCNLKIRRLGPRLWVPFLLF